MAKHFSGILIQPEDVRAIVVKPVRGGLRVIAGGVQELGPEEQKAPAPGVRALMKRIKPAPLEAALCLPKEQAMLRHSMLPSTDSDELEGMARFEAERHIPFNAERHGVGHQVIANRGVEGSEVLLAAADGPVIDRAVDAARDAGIQPTGLNVSSACLVNALLYSEPEVARAKTVVIVSIGMTALDLVFVSAGRLLFSRSVPVGLAGLVSGPAPAAGLGAVVRVDRAKAAVAAKMLDLMDLDHRPGEAPPRPGAPRPGDAARAWISRILQELKRTYDFARREVRCPGIEAVILTGEGAILRNLEQYVYVNLNLEVMTLNPVAPILEPKAADLPFGGLELVVPFGAAVARQVEGGYSLDLTPKGVYRRLERRRLLKNSLVSGGFAAVTLALAFLAWSQLRSVRAEEMNEYRAANKLMTEEVARLREAEKKLTILEAFLDDPASALASLGALVRAPQIPARISFTRLSFSKSDQFVIEGHALEITDITALAEELKASELFEDVKVIEQKRQPKLQGRPEVYVFRLQCKIPVFEPKAKKRKAADISEEPLAEASGPAAAETEFGPRAAETNP